MLAEREKDIFDKGNTGAPGGIWSRRSATSASNCTVSAPRSDCSSSVVVAPTIAVETTGLHSSQASATSAGFAPAPQLHVGDQLGR
jgi:hypothetical protein